MTCVESPRRPPARVARLWDALRLGIAEGTAAPAAERQPVRRNPRGFLGRSPQQCTMIGIDIVGYGSHRRDDDVRDFLREAMYRLMEDAFTDAHLPWRACQREDRGDGVLLMLPPGITPQSSLDPLVEYVHARVRRHNKMTSGPAQMRIRMAVHVGIVRRDDHGVSGGQELIHLCRLLDAPAFSRALATSSALVGLIVSEYVYETVIRHGRGLLDPDDYRALKVVNKEVRTRAWVYLPVRSTPEVVLVGSHPPVPQQAGGIVPWSPGAGRRPGRRPCGSGLREPCRVLP